MVIASFSLPFLQTILHTIPLGFFDFLLICLFALFNVCLIEVVKYFIFEKDIKKFVPLRGITR